MEKKSIRKTIFNIFVILSSAIILIALIFFTDGFDKLQHMLKNINYVWIVAGFGCMVMYWFIETFILQVITQSLFEKQLLVNSLKVTMIGNFFNSITPFAMGGQPVQAYVMVKDGVKPGHCASILMIKSALFQTVIMFYCIVVLIFRGGFLASGVPKFYLLYFIGLFFNVIAIALYALFFFNREAAHKVLEFVFRLLKKLKFLKNLDKTRSKIEYELISFSDGVHILKNKIGVLLVAIVLQVLQFTFFFAIPYFISLAVGGEKQSLLTMVTAQAVVTMLTLFVPSPGSTGGAEGISYLFFKMFFKYDIIIPIILIWRILTYYSNIVCGGLFAVFSPEKPLKKGQ